MRNVRQTGEFVWNLVTRPLAEAMSTSCAAVPPEVSEFVLAGLTPGLSRVISVPRVAESPVLRGGRPDDYFEIGPAQLFRMRRPQS